MKRIRIKYTGLKLGNTTAKHPRTAYEVACDNIAHSNPPPKEKDIITAISESALAISELHCSVLKFPK